MLKEIRIFSEKILTKLIQSVRLLKYDKHPSVLKSNESLDGKQRFYDLLRSDELCRDRPTECSKFAAEK